jgi:D-aminopeptidase
MALKREELVHEKSIYPGVKRTDDWKLTYENDDLMEVMKAFNRMH